MKNFLILFFLIVSFWAYPKLASAEAVFSLSAENLQTEISSLKNLEPRPKFLKVNGVSLQSFLGLQIKPPAELTPKQKQAYAALAQIYKKASANLTNQPAKNAVWEERDGWVTKFEPGNPGLVYSPYENVKKALAALKESKTEIAIEPIVVPAEISLDEVNAYGITELIAEGQSSFAGSSRNRIQNIQVGMSRYRGLLIKPGETFSFNNLLGPIDGQHGWAPEMVIKHNGVVPEFGGGICQVSTTVFRAALNAGLPIVERRNHSLAVAYYAPQGTDATIYTGVIDLKFKNDTGSYILVWPEIKGAIITFKFYGKGDGRQVVVDKPVPYGWQTSGAFRTSLKRTITNAAGEQKEDVFLSYYRPRAEFTQTTTAEEPVPKPVEEEKPEEPTESEAGNEV